MLEPYKWNPRLMLCPSDEKPADQHSYVLNNYFYTKKIKYGRTRFKFRTVSDVVVMGEKKSSEALNIQEAQRLSGSCPMIFTWNGERFQFITDVLGVAPLGASSGDGN